MGLSPFKNSVGNCAPPNPDPAKFDILDAMEFPGSSRTVTVLEVQYPGCTTHDGRKILVYEARVRELFALTTLDPHFLETERSPIARFPATEEGRLDAMAYAAFKSHR